MPEPRHIVVDGSNLATEGRKLPSLAQLDQAVRAYVAEDPEAEVVVVVDASFEHRIDASERDQLEQAELHGEVVSPPAGAIGRGDAFLLRIAQRTGATVLSNDSFQEFHGEHPWLFDDGRLIGGKPVPGVGWIFTPRVPVRGPKSRQATGKAKRDQARVNGGASLTAPLKAAELAKAAKKAARAAKRSHRLPDGSAPKIGDVWVEPEPEPVTPSEAPVETRVEDGRAGGESPAGIAAVEATVIVEVDDEGGRASGVEKRPKAAASATKKATTKKSTVKKAAKKTAAKKAATKKAPAKTTPAKTTPAKTTAVKKPVAERTVPEKAVAEKTATKKAATKKAASKTTPAKKAAKPAKKAAASPAAKKAATKRVPAKTTKKTAAGAPEEEPSAEGGPLASDGRGAEPAGTGAPAPAEDLAGADEGRRSRRRASQDVQVRDAIVEATVEALIPPSVVEPKAKGSRKGKRRRRVATPPPAANDPLPFITFVAAYPIGSTVVGEVASFTSHGAMVEVDLPGGGGLHCYVPLAGLGDPPPTKARQIIAKGDRREFVLVSLDPPRRVAELALAPAGARPGPT